MVLSACTSVLVVAALVFLWVAELGFAELSAPAPLFFSRCQAIFPRALHFLAILQNSYQDGSCRAVATAELGTHLWRTNSPDSMYGQRHSGGTRRNSASGVLVRTALYGAENFAAMKAFAMALCMRRLATAYAD